MLSNIFASIANAKPEKVNSIESQQAPELTSRLQVKIAENRLSLSEKIRLRRLALAYRSQGLDRLLDITPLDQGEFVIFCRKHSLLLEKIKQTRQARSLEETVKAMIQASSKGHCLTCYELHESCHCEQA